MSALRWRFVAWLLGVVVLCGYFFAQVLPNLKLETDITAMLPALGERNHSSPELADGIRRVTDRSAQQVLWLVGAPTFKDARAAAQLLADTLQSSGVFNQVHLQTGAAAQAVDTAYGRARLWMLSDRHRELLAKGQAAMLGEEALRSLYTPTGLVRARPFTEDPLNLFGDFLSQQIPAVGKLQPREGVLSLSKGGMDYVLVRAELKDSPFAIAIQKQAGAALSDAVLKTKSQSQGVAVYCSGVLQHAIANSERAAAEVSLFGSVSILGVVLVLVLTFRSPRPLLLSLVCLGVGTIAAITVCSLIFDRIHLMALVFGSSLVGVGVDYSLHFFTDQFRDPRRWNGGVALRHVGPAIAVGVVTTTLGYLALLLPAFPGLRQMAVLSVTAVATSAVCVLMAYPMLAGAGKAAPPAVSNLMLRLARLQRPAMRYAIPVAVLFAAHGCWKLGFIDDIRTLQSSPTVLLAQEEKVRELLGGGLDSRFFIVRGKDAESVLQSEELLRTRLDPLISAQKLAGYSALSKALPSMARQKQNEAWLAQQVYGADGTLAELLRQVGYEAKAVQDMQAVFEQHRGQYLHLQDWLKAESSAPFLSLWLSAGSGEVASMVALNGVRDVAALRDIEGLSPDIRMVDRVEDISQVLSHYRTLSLWGLGLVLGVIGLILVIRYGWRRACRHIIAPMGGCVLTLATLGWLGIPANLFSVLALLLVLGLGVDYSVFLEEGSASRDTSLLAISLAGLTTMLSFGMLAASATPFIASLGLSVLLGVGYTWILALLASAPTSNDNLRVTPRATS